MKKLNDVIVERLLKIMGEKDMTQYRLAMQSGVPYPTIKSIMQRRTKDINFKSLFMLICGLGISIEEFFNDEDFKLENLDLD